MDAENNSIDRFIDAIKGGDKKENGDLLTFLETQQMNNLARVRNDLLVKENDVSSERDNLIEERRMIFDEATFTNDSIARHEAAKKLLSFDRKAHDYSQLMDSISSQIALVLGKLQK